MTQRTFAWPGRICPSENEPRRTVWNLDLICTVWCQNKSMCWPWQSSGARCILEEPVDWADGFVVVYNISDRTSFINAKNILRQIREARVDNCKGSGAQWGYFTVTWTEAEQLLACCFKLFPQTPSWMRLRELDRILKLNSFCKCFLKFAS